MSGSGVKILIFIKRGHGQKYELKKYGNFFAVAARALAEAGDYHGDEFWLTSGELVELAEECDVEFTPEEAVEFLKTRCNRLGDHLNHSGWSFIKSVLTEYKQKEGRAECVA